jgi:hypothetical protein
MNTRVKVSQLSNLASSKNMTMELDPKQIYRRTFLHIGLVGLVVFMHLIFGEDIVYTFLEGIHLFMEMLEQILDFLLEHFFHTERRATQIIVFYVLLIFGGLMAFFIWKKLVELWQTFWRFICNDYLALKSVVKNDWANFSTIDKSLWLSLLFLAIYFAPYLFS